MNTNPNEIEKKNNFKFGIQIGTDNNILKKKTQRDDFSDEMLSGNEFSKEDESSGEYRNGRWHPNEHYRFIKGCLLYGNNWKKVNIINI